MIRDDWHHGPDELPPAPTLLDHLVVAAVIVGVVALIVFVCIVAPTLHGM